MILMIEPRSANLTPHIMHRVYLSLGSNLGNRKRNIREAITRIGELIGDVERQSSLYETKPWGYSSPNDFINACICVLTPLAPRQLLEATQCVEQEMGRTLKSQNGEYIDEPDLQIPHPLMEERDFVMVPLREIMHEE